MIQAKIKQALNGALIPDLQCNLLIQGFHHTISTPIIIPDDLTELKTASRMIPGLSAYRSHVLKREARMETCFSALYSCVLR